MNRDNRLLQNNIDNSDYGNEDLHNYDIASDKAKNLEFLTPGF